MSEEGETKVQLQWRQGFWKMGAFAANILQTSGDNKFIWKNSVALDYPDIEAGSFVIDCEFGNFGEAKTEIANATGEKYYNFNASSPMINCKGVMNADGTKITVWGISNAMEEWVWMDESMVQEIKDNRDPFEAPACPHIKAQPEKEGKIFWVSGPAGSGKSTTCQLLARMKGYIYFEADCLEGLINPFTDINAENASLAAFAAKPLKNVPKETATTFLSATKNVEEYLGGDITMEALEGRMRPYNKAIAEYITMQKNRLGGSFVVAHSVATAKDRECIQSHAGAEVIFIVLNMTVECQRERIKQRHGDTISDYYSNLYKMYQPAQEGEKNTYGINIDQGMSKDDVLEEALKIVATA